MVPMEAFPLEKQYDEDRKDYQGNHFLDDLELNEAERTSVDLRTYPVGRYHETVFQKGNTPGHKYHEYEGPILDGWVDLGELQLSVPGEGHENVGADQQ